MKEESTVDLTATAKFSFLQSDKGSDCKDFPTPPVSNTMHIKQFTGISSDRLLATPSAPITQIDYSESDCKRPDPFTVDEFEIDLGVPTLKWCAYCGKERVAGMVMKPSKTTFWSSVGIFLMG